MPAVLPLISIPLILMVHDALVALTNTIGLIDVPDNLPAPFHTKSEGSGYAVMVPHAGALITVLPPPFWLPITVRLLLPKTTCSV